MLKFRTWANLLEFSPCRPGGLAAQFAAMVHEKVTTEAIRDERQLYDVDFGKGRWEMANLKELRDRREVQTFALALQRVVHIQIP